MPGFILALIMLAGYAAPEGPSGSWRWQNPRPQGNPLYAVVFADARRGLAVGRDAAILRTADGGQSWQVVRGSVSTPLYGLALKGRRAWAVGARGLIITSRNGGESWTERPLPAGATQVYAMACA